MRKSPSPSAWVRWRDREELQCAFPGVYILARSAHSLAGKPFSWTPEIIYVGMTNGAAGLRGRLAQFDQTVSGRRLSHGGADRVRFKHNDYGRLCRALYVSVIAFKCDPTSQAPSDLRVMGEVAKMEFTCLAEYAQRFGRLPQFNNKTTSPKLSKSRRVVAYTR